MRKPLSIFVLLVALVGASGAQEKPRLFVLTDISNEPDDEESLVRLLVYANEFDVEGLVATISTWLKTKPREDLIRRDIAAYAEVRTNLLKHAPGFPPAEQLLAVTKTGQTNYGMALSAQEKVHLVRNSLLTLRTKTIHVRFGLQSGVEPTHWLKR